jgi:hypothetical protein
MKFSILTQVLIISLLLLATEARLGKNNTVPVPIFGETSKANQSGPVVAERSLVVLGRNAYVNRYPFYTIFYHGNEYCSGSLIAPGVVLTAAGCSVAKGDYVRVGSVYWDDVGNLCTATVLDFKRHPFYNPTNDGDDIMLLRLSDLCSQVSPVKLSTRLPTTADGVVGMGMGDTDPNVEGVQHPYSLQEIILKRVSDSNCEAAIPYVWMYEKICYWRGGGYSYGAGMWEGDEGGPIIVYRNRGYDQVAVHTLSRMNPNTKGIYSIGNTFVSQKCWIDFVSCQFMTLTHQPSWCFKTFKHVQTGLYIGIEDGEAKLFPKGDTHIIKLALRYDKRLITYTAPGQPYHLMHLDELNDVTVQWWRNDPHQQWEAELAPYGPYGKCTFLFKNVGSGDYLDDDDTNDNGLETVAFDRHCTCQYFVPEE